MAEVSSGTGRVGKSSAVILVQALNSISTVLQMGVFALTLPRADFDDYAVWVTSGMFVIGLGQAIGTERVVIGRRLLADGTHSAGVLAAMTCLVQLSVAAALGSLPLLLASLTVAPYVAYDFQRFTRCYDEGRRFLRADLAVLAAQTTSVLVLWALLGREEWWSLVWWAVGLPVWVALAGGGPHLVRGWRVLRGDARECLPLLLDAVLAGVPLVAALALAKAQGSVGDASAARMAFTILGPVTVLGLSARRLVYQEVAKGPLSPRFAVVWTGICVATFVVCGALLALTRTPLYPWAFPGFVGLTWLAILGFATNHTAMFSTLLPAASLRAEGRAREIGAARVLATLAAVGVGWSVAPFDSPADVAWCVAAGSIAYSLSLAVARALVPRRPAPSSEDSAPSDPAPAAGGAS